VRRQRELATWQATMHGEFGETERILDSSPPSERPPDTVSKGHVAAGCDPESLQSYGKRVKQRASLPYIFRTVAVWTPIWILHRRRVHCVEVNLLVLHRTHLLFFPSLTRGIECRRPGQHNLSAVDCHSTKSRIYCRARQRIGKRAESSLPSPATISGPPLTPLHAGHLAILAVSECSTGP
jgi:hypothetical protein